MEISSTYEWNKGGEKYVKVRVTGCLYNKNRKVYRFRAFIIESQYNTCPVDTTKEFPIKVGWKLVEEQDIYNQLIELLDKKFNT